MRNPRIRAAATTGLIEAVEAAGGQPLRVLAAADLTKAELADPDRFIDMRRIAALFEAAATETRNELFGLQVSLASTLDIVGTLSYLLLNAPTVETALNNLQRYSSLHMPGAPIFLERGPTDAHLVLEMSESVLGPCRQLVEACVGFTLMVLRTLTRQEMVPRRILFAHARPEHASAQEVRLFGSPVAFAQARNEMLFDRRWLAYPIASADRTLLPIVEKYVEGILEAQEDEDILVTSVRELVAQAVCHGHPNIALIARHVGMSARTLQRRLADADTSFKKLLDDVRSDLAREYLSRSAVGVTEVSFLLGYSELSAFDRAFRRWTGMAPLKYRHGIAH